MTGTENFTLLACDDDGRQERAFDPATDGEAFVRLRTSVKVDEARLATVPGVNIRSVALIDVRRTHDEIAAIVARFPSLQELRVTEGKGVNDDTCRVIAEGLPELRRLWVFMSAIGDDGAAAIASMRELTTVTVMNARLTDIGLASFAQLPALSYLRVDGNFKIEGPGLEPFRGHSELSELWMAGTRVTDADVAHLSDCPKLMTTFLRSTAVTAACVRVLPQHPYASVYLPQQLDPATVDQARRDCPNLVIDGFRAADMTGFAADSADDGNVPPVLRRGARTIAVFSAPWCQPCVALKQNLGLVRPSLREQYRYVEIDVDQDPATSEAMNVRTVPSTIVLVDGHEAFRFQGVVREPELTSLLEKWAAY